MNVIIKKTAKRRTIAISVKPNLDVVVLASTKISDAKINEILHQKQSWIQKKLQHFQNTKTVVVKFEKIEDGQKIYLLGRQVLIRIVNINTKKIIFDGNVIMIYCVYERAHVVLNKWIVEMAFNFFQERLKSCFQVFSQKIECKMPDLKVKKMKGRWGAMSSSGFMSLNLCLICVNLECIDYVIMHELCHVKHMNHGTKFYDLQELFVPDYRNIKKILESFVIV